MSLPRVLVAAIAAFAACPIGAGAQQGRPTVATILKMQTGDVACYVELRDDSGKSHREMADFPICQQTSLINRRVRLTYRQDKVMAAACQGDESCKKTDTVMLIVAARPTPVVAATSHCTSSETILFSCPTGANVVSVCASGGAQGYIQYRFGKPGAPPEMALPEARIPPTRAAAGENVPFAGGGGQWLRFTRGAYGYVVYSGIGNWGPKGEKKAIDGVIVENNGKRTANVKCTARPSGSLQPATFETLGIRPGKQDFDFPTED